MELTACALNLREKAEPRASRYLSVKFGLGSILEKMGVDLETVSFLERARILEEEYGEGTGWARTTYLVFGIYLAELIALAHGYLKMAEVAVFGGLSKNSTLVNAARSWLSAMYPDIDLIFVSLREDYSYINALGAAYFAGQEGRLSTR